MRSDAPHESPKRSANWLWRVGPFRTYVFMLCFFSLPTLLSAQSSLPGYYAGGQGSGVYETWVKVQPNGLISQLRFKASYSCSDNYQGPYTGTSEESFMSLSPDSFSRHGGWSTASQNNYLDVAGGWRSDIFAFVGTFDASQYGSWHVYQSYDHVQSGSLSGAWFASLVELGPVVTNRQAWPTSVTRESFAVTVVFSKAVQQVDAGDLRLSGPAVTPFTVVGTPYSTNSGAAWIFPITGLCYGILTNVLCLGDAGITDSHDINVPELQWFFETGVLRPVILAHPVSCTNDAGNSVQFSVNAVGPPFEGCQYQWLKDGTNVVAESGVTGVNTNVLTLADIRPAAAGNYQVVVANAFGSVTSRVAVLVINTTPRITAQPTSRNLFAGESASFAVAVVGPGPLAYQWLKDGQPLADGGRFSGATNSSLSVTGALVPDAGTYSVRVSNVYTNITSSTALLQVVKRTQTLSFGAVSPQVFQGDAPFIIAATASSGLVVALEHTAGPGSLAGNTFSLGAEGVVNIRGVQGGNDFYLPTTNQVSFRVVGQTPVSVNVPTSVDLVGAAYGDGMFVVVGDQNQSYASSNGVNWVMIPAEPGGPGKNFRAVTYGVGAFYAVAADKSSPDNWRVMRWNNGGTWQTVFKFGKYGIMHYDYPTDIAGSANDVGVSFYEARYSSTYSKWYYTPKLWRLSAGTLVLGGSSPTDSIACRGQEFYLPMGFWGGDGTFYRVVPGESPSLWSLPGGVERIAASPARLAGMSWGSSSIKSSLGSYDSWADRYTTRTGLNGISHVGHQFIGAGW